VSPDFRRLGIGREIVKRLMSRYRGFHQHMLVAEAQAVPFYDACGFVRAGQTTSMWVFKGTEHG
jgi:GNAT superfamily N-acetyltransferase